MKHLLTSYKAASQFTGISIRRLQRMVERRSIRVIKFSAETESLVILRVKINRAAWPNARSKKQINVRSLTEIIVREKALGSTVG